MTQKRESRTTSKDHVDLHSLSSNPVIRGLPDGAIVVFDDNLRYLVAGGQGLSLVGMTPASMEGKTIFEVFPPEVSRALELPYRRALNGEDVELDVTYGERTFFHRLAPLKLDPGTTNSTGIGFALDVTNVRRSEASLRVSDENLRIERRRH